MSKINATLSADASFRGSSIALTAAVGGSAGFALSGRLDTITLSDILSTFPLLSSLSNLGLPDVTISQPTMTVSESGLSVASGENAISIAKNAEGGQSVSLKVDPFLPALNLNTLSLAWDGKNLIFNEPNLDQILSFEKLWQRIKSVEAPTCAEISDDVLKDWEPTAKFSVKPSLGHQAGYILVINNKITYTISIKGHTILSIDAPPISLTLKSAPTSFAGLFEQLVESLLSPQALDHLLMPLLRNPVNSATFFGAIAATEAAKKALSQAFSCRGWKTEEPDSDGDVEPPFDEAPLLLAPAEGEGFETVGAVVGLVVLANSLPHESGGSGSSSEGGGGHASHGDGGGGHDDRHKAGGGSSDGQTGGSPNPDGGIAPMPLDPPAAVSLTFDADGVLARWAAVVSATGYDVELTSKGDRFAAPPIATIRLVPDSHDEDLTTFPQARFPTADCWSGDVLSVRVRALGGMPSGWSEPADLTLPRIEPDTPLVAQVGDNLVMTWRPAPGDTPRDYEVRLCDSKGWILPLPDRVEIDAKANIALIGDYNAFLMSNYMTREAALTVGVLAKNTKLKSAWVTAAPFKVMSFPNNLHFEMPLRNAVGATSVIQSDQWMGATAAFGTNAKRPSGDWFRVVSSWTNVLRLRGLGIQRGAKQRAVVVTVSPLPYRRVEVPFLLQNLMIEFTIGGELADSTAYSFILIDSIGRKTVVPAICATEQNPWRQYTVAQSPLRIWVNGPLRVTFQATTKLPDTAFIEVYGMELYFGGYADGTRD